MTFDLTAHVKPDHLDDQAKAIHEAYVNTCRRTMEIMILEMHGILRRHPEVVEVSFDQEGDTDSMPMFSCLDADGEDMAEMFEDVEAVAERWNETRNPAAVSFMELMEGKKLRRNTLDEDRLEMCKIFARRVPGDAKENNAWVASFDSYVRAMDMDRDLPMAKDAKLGLRL